MDKSYFCMVLFSQTVRASSVNILKFPLSSLCCVLLFPVWDNSPHPLVTCAHKHADTLETSLLHQTRPDQLRGSWRQMAVGGREGSRTNKNCKNWPVTWSGIQVLRMSWLDKKALSLSATECTVMQSLPCDPLYSTSAGYTYIWLRLPSSHFYSSFLPNLEL